MQIILKLICFLGILITSSLATLLAQNIQLTGKIIDAKTQEPIPFAHVIINKNQLATNSDIDGKFNVTAKQKIDLIQFSCIGYETFKYEVKAESDLRPLNKPLNIFLVPTVTSLTEVTIKAGENPANSIIRKVVANRKNNNPERKKSFKYMAYNKFILTTQNKNEKATLDSIYKDIEKDSLRKVKKAQEAQEILQKNPPKNPKKKAKLEKDLKVKVDKSELNTYQHFKQHHVFMLESVSERKFMQPNYDKVMILSNKVSGLQTPTFTSLATDFQPFAFYNDYLTILGKDFLNPISEGSTEKYFFEIKDTLYQAKDTIYIVGFQPFKKKKFNALEGVLYINTHKYAIQNVKAHSADSLALLRFNIEQQYEMLGNQWFPTQLHADIIFSEIETLNVSLIGVARSYLQDIEINPLFKRKDFDDISLAFLPNATEPQDSLWRKYRAEKLTPKELKTYKYLDSLGKKYKFDRWTKALNMLATNKIPYKIIDFDISQLIRANGYEGLRLGTGIYTNDKLSKKYSFGGYYAYGFKDKASKFGVSAVVKFPHLYQLQVGVHFLHDVFEPANLNFIGRKPLIAGENFRNFLTFRMDKTESWQLQSQLKPFHNLTLAFKLQRNWLQTGYNYTFIKEGEPQKSFVISELGVALHYAFKEKYTQLGNEKVYTGSEFPILSLTIAQGLPNFLGANYQYTRFNLRAEHHFKNALSKQTHLSFMLGAVQGQVPYPLLFNGSGSASANRFSILVGNTFQTMGLYEFVANRFWQLFVNQQLTEPLIRIRLSAPELHWVQGVSFGYLNSPENHLEIGAKSWQRGFWESGLLVKNIIRLKQGTYYWGYDIGVFARYGHYAKPQWQDNFVFRLGLNLSF